MNRSEEEATQNNIKRYLNSYSNSVKKSSFSKNENICNSSSKLEIIQCANEELFKIRSENSDNSCSFNPNQHENIKNSFFNLYLIFNSK